MPTSSPELIDLLCRWQQQRRLGTSVDVEQLCADAPDLVDALKQQIAALESMERLLGTNLTIDGVDHAAATVDREATTGGFDAGRATTPQHVSIHDTIPSPPGYEILSELGRGGMGVVYKALQVKAKRIVALKMILSGVHASQSALERFRIEGESIARLQHPNIVQVFDVGEHNRTPYFALEFCDGGNLAKKLAGTPLPGKDAAILVEKLARAVAEAHAKGIIHRDLKPANVLLTLSGEPKVTDFGLAKQMDSAHESEPDAKRASDSSPQREQGSDLTQTGAVMGTPSYMAPEQASGDTKRVGPPCDVYALGVILYECLTGRPPFKGLNYVETLDQVRHQEPVPPSQLNSKVPRDLETICLKCLRKEPEKRYVGASKLADDVRRYLDGKPIVARAVGRGERAVKWVRRNPVITGATLAFVLALAVGGAIAYVKYIEAEKARGAEAKRVEERDVVIGQRDKAIDDEKTRVDERNAAIKNANERLDVANTHLTNATMLQAWTVFESGDVNRTRHLLNQVPLEYRRWEWGYLFRQLDASIFNLPELSGASFTPDGRCVVSALKNRVRVWDARTGATLLEFQAHNGAIRSATFSPDGTLLLTTGEGDRIAKVWNSRNGQLVKELIGHDAPVSQATYSPNGARILTTAFDSKIRVWEAKSGSLLTAFDIGTLVTMGFAFSQDGSRVVSIGSDKSAKRPTLKPGVNAVELNWDTVHVWDATTGGLFVRMKGHAGNIHSVSYSPDGTRVLTAGNDKTARVWDSRSGEVLTTLQGHKEGINSAVFSPNGARIASASEDGTVRIWNSVSGKGLAEFRGHTASVRGVHFSPDGTGLMTTSADTTVRIWDLQQETCIAVLRGHTGSPLAAYTLDGMRVLTWSPDGLRVWDVPPPLELDEPFTKCLGISADGKSCVTSGFDWRPIPRVKQGTAWIYDTQTGRQLLPLVGHAKAPSFAVFSRDGSRVITSGFDSTTLVWDASSGRILHTLKGKFPSRRTGLSPDGLRVATQNKANGICLWETVNGKQIAELTGHTDSIWDAAFSPDSKRMATISRDKTIRIWNVETGEVIRILHGHEGFTNTITFSPDGSRLVTTGRGKENFSSNSIIVWDASTATKLLQISCPEGATDNGIFSPDGMQVLAGTSSSSHKSVRVWDAHSGTLKVTIQDSTRPITSSVSYSATYSPDGTRILTVLDGMVRVWDSRTGVVVAKLTEKDAAEASFTTDGNRITVEFRNGKVRVFDAEVNSPRLDETELTTRQYRTRPLPKLHSAIAKRHASIDSFASATQQSLEQRAEGLLAAEAFDFDKAHAHFLAAAVLRPKPPKLEANSLPVPEKR